MYAYQTPALLFQAADTYINFIKGGIFFMDTYVILKDLAIIIVFAKLFGILARKCKAPQVVGELIAGIVLGPSVLGLVQQSDFLAQMAEIGVILLMFSAGLGTSLKDLLRTGVKSLLIACAGVFVPLVLGAILYMSFYGFSAVGTEEFCFYRCYSDCDIGQHHRTGLERTRQAENRGWNNHLKCSHHRRCHWYHCADCCHRF